MSITHLSTLKALQKEFKELNETPMEGFRVRLLREDNMFEWEVAIFGPPQTLYQGGYFKAKLRFPPDYPYSPPSMKFLNKMFHPNIYANGDVCISILHTPGADPHSYEPASERWNPTQNVRTILLSVISMLNEPNICSAAHVEASVSFRQWQQSGYAKEDGYAEIVRKLVHETKADALRDNVVVPQTLEEYCVSGKTQVSSSSHNSSTDKMMDEDCFMQEYDDFDVDDVAGDSEGYYHDDDTLAIDYCSEEEMEETHMSTLSGDKKQLSSQSIKSISHSEALSSTSTSSVHLPSTQPAQSLFSASSVLTKSQEGTSRCVAGTSPQTSSSLSTSESHIARSSQYH